MRTLARFGNERTLELMAGFGAGFAVILSAFTLNFTVVAILFCVAGEVNRMIFGHNTGP